MKIALLSAVWLIYRPEVLCVAVPRAFVHDSSLTIQNDLVSFVFDENLGGLTSLVDVALGNDICRDEDSGKSATSLTNRVMYMYFH